MKTILLSILLFISCSSGTVLITNVRCERDYYIIHFEDKKKGIESWQVDTIERFKIGERIKLDEFYRYY